MTADPSHQDPKALWQGQSPETDAMTLEQIHDLVRRYERRLRLRLLMVPVGLTFMGFVFGQAWTANPDLLARTGFVLTVLGALVMLYLAIPLLFPSRDPAESAAAYLRRRLQRALTAARGGWLLRVAPLLPGFLVGQLAAARHAPAGPTWAHLLPLAVMVLALLVVVVSNRRRASRLARELAELDALMGA